MRLLAEAIEDCRYSIRQLFQHASFTIVTIVILGLGIGATTAIFSVINSMLLRPLPVSEPQRLVTLSTPFRANAGLRTFWSFAIWERIRSNAQLFDGAFAWSAQRFNLSDRGEAAPVSGIFASSEYFTTLGVRALMGRTFDASDDASGGGADERVAIISYGLWQRRYGGAPDVIGRRLAVESVPFTIIGVMPRGFFGTEVGQTVDVALPLGAERSIHPTNSAVNTPGWYWLSIMFRLKAGQTLDTANAALHAIGPGIIRDAIMPTDLPLQFLPQLQREPFIAAPGITGVSTIRNQYNRPLLILLALVFVLLLIACANVANLLLARAISRRYEITVRLALGASRWRLVRQTLIESLILSAISSAAGLSISSAGSRVLVGQLSGPANPVFLDLSMDWRIMAFTTGLAVATAMLFGTAPAWISARMAPIDALKERGRGTSSVSRGVLSSGLVVGQVALSIVLLVIAGLVVGTLANLSHVPTGYDARRIAVLDVSLRNPPADPIKRLSLFRDLVNAASAVPGVEHAGGSFATPISDTRFAAAIESPALEASAGRDELALMNFVTPGWFETYGMTMLAGRDFGDADVSNAQGVAVVNEAFVRRFLPARNPIGETVKFSFNSRDFSNGKTIVGVTSDAVYQSLRDGMQPTIYMPIVQWDLATLFSNITISIRAADRPSAALARAVADAVTRVGGDISFTFHSLADQVDASLAREKAVAKLSACFGIMALVLASAGLYGLMSYRVSQRRLEIGVRLALGATPSAVIGLVFRKAYLLVALGIALGVVASFWTSRLVASLLFGIEPHDTLVLAASTLVLTIAATAAAWLPAARASRTDPAAVLRSDFEHPL